MLGAMQGARVLLIVGGGIAAYKALELVRRLRDRGAAVTPVMTEGASRFVTPTSLAALAGAEVRADLWDLGSEARMGHIELSRSADLVVVAPATADLLARMAAGLADDLATTLLLATDKRVLVAPGMNVRMWEHPATRRNLAALRGDGVLVVGPEAGEMACGEWGEGRMSEPGAIVAAVEAALGLPGLPPLPPRDGPLRGRHVLVTSGPTREPIDPVRYIANRSSGAQGAAIGAALADWRVEGVGAQKVKKGDAPPVLRLVENPDILRTLSRMGEGRPRLVVGFAAETESVLENARAKRLRKGCDWILANDVSPGSGIMGGRENAVTLVTAEGEEGWPRMAKAEVAARLAERIAAALA